MPRIKSVGVSWSYTRKQFWFTKPPNAERVSLYYCPHVIKLMIRHQSDMHLSTDYEYFAATMCVTNKHESCDNYLYLEIFFCYSDQNHKPI